MAMYFHGHQLQEDCDWLSDYSYIPYEEYDKERERLINKNRNIIGVSENNIYALYNMTFYPIEELIQHKMKDEEMIRKEKEKFQLSQEYINNVIKTHA